MPSVSVVTATYNRAPRLERLIRSLEEQSVHDFEMRVVDDCSTDGTWGLLQSAAERYSWLHPMRMKANGGPARARNAGWRAAVAPIVAFTDDDCVPGRDWLARILEEFDDETTDIVQGATLPDSEEFWRRGPFDHSVRVESQSPMFETCNIAFRRSLLAELDGFDEAFTEPFGEDADLGWRALERGVKPRFVPGAQVTHDVTPRDFMGKLRGERRRTGLVTAVKMHPGLREHLWRKVFYDPTHPRLLGSALSAALVLHKPSSPWRWVLLSQTTASYVRLRKSWSIVRGPRKKWPLWLAQLAVLDAVDIARLARASAREKTLVL